MLQSMGSQRVRHDLVTEQIIIIDITDVWIEICYREEMETI